MKQVRFFSLFLLMLLPFAVAQAEFDEGIEYKRLSNPVPTEDPGRIEVVELFWYGCPHCYRAEPYVKRWLKKKPENVYFKHIPAVFNSKWAFHAKAFYTAEALGVMDKFHPAMFDAIQVQHRKMATPEELRKLFASLGVPEADFNKAFNSFMVDSRVRRATDLTRRYGISGVPSLVVDGKYVTDGPMANGHAGMFKVVDYLIGLEEGKK